MHICPVVWPTLPCLAQPQAGLDEDGTQVPDWMVSCFQKKRCDVRFTPALNQWSVLGQITASISPTLETLTTGQAYKEEARAGDRPEKLHPTERCI
jgi:hypothetical protein